MKSYKIVDEYLENFSGETKEILIKIRTIIDSAIPDAEQTIGYGIPTFKLNGKYVVYFAGYAKHVSLYPIPPGPASFQKSIEPYIAGKGTLKFIINKSIPYDLIKEIVKFSLKAHKERMKNN